MKWSHFYLTLFFLIGFTAIAAEQVNKFQAFDPQGWIDKNWNADANKTKSAFESTYKEKPLSYSGKVTRLNKQEGLVVFQGGGVHPKNWDVQISLQDSKELSEITVGQDITLYGQGDTIKNPFGIGGNSFRLKNGTKTSPPPSMMAADNRGQEADKNKTTQQKAEPSQARFAPGLLQLQYAIGTITLSDDAKRLIVQITDENAEALKSKGYVSSLEFRSEVIVDKGRPHIVVYRPCVTDGPDERYQLSIPSNDNKMLGLLRKGAEDFAKFRKTIEGIPQSREGVVQYEDVSFPFAYREEFLGRFTIMEINRGTEGKLTLVNPGRLLFVLDHIADFEGSLFTQALAERKKKKDSVKQQIAQLKQQDEDEQKKRTAQIIERKKRAELFVVSSSGKELVQKIDKLWSDIVEGTKVTGLNAEQSRAQMDLIKQTNAGLITIEEYQKGMAAFASIGGKKLSDSEELKLRRELDKMLSQFFEGVGIFKSVKSNADNLAAYDAVKNGDFRTGEEKEKNAKEVGMRRNAFAQMHKSQGNCKIALEVATNPSGDFGSGFRLDADESPSICLPSGGAQELDALFKKVLEWSEVAIKNNLGISEKEAGSIGAAGKLFFVIGPNQVHGVRIDNKGGIIKEGRGGKVLPKAEYGIETIKQFDALLDLLPEMVDNAELAALEAISKYRAANRHEDQQKVDQLLH